MPCPTCNETMQNVGATDQRIFWCPRCGTLKLESGDHEDVEQPFWMKWPATSHSSETLADIKRGGAVSGHEGFPQ